MSSPQIFIAASIAVLGIIALLLFVAFRQRTPHRLTPLAGLALAFVLAGMFVDGDGRFVAYGLMGAGVLLALIDMRLKSRKAQ